MSLSFKDGVYACIPTLLGYIGIGIAAGVVGKSSHLSVLEVTLLAVIVYAGAAQFIIAGLMLVATPITAIIFTVFLVNSRHFLMSMATAPAFRQYSLLNNIGIGTLLTDESFAVAMNALSNKEPINASWMHGLNLTAYIAWILSCLIGALIGEWLPNPMQFGLDYALVAMFIGLLYLQLISDKTKSLKNRLIVMLTVAVMLVLLMRFVSPEMAILISTFAGCFMGIAMERNA
ncbi:MULTISPECIES: AzlC family ABC transporter permease [unclassified Gilliamella]|uniref:AzlC family ABC transporter permease n=1 Tax=unclassified Gilliamella TaxID=2685620 RepID=UPI001C6A0D2B|nr:MULTISPECIES: AzlC family ABC transporter permease [unclassified Gilliamella]MCX8602578.1 AzlC family ABC transporter permease [Gilliamella sp. B3722]MCX8607978.1 AzlC family ABC transporter permease [Gilliamella sp. B3771]MCX8611746.1 AzlC family ABC transporter permease [Gilliamella sp. B3891]MCX8614222.1 AzlC family ABC transporter permease [Gilliamella sp. B3773]MCX8615895.1 AzlC family ABC transporter permease [Gilliamella sp. B3770]